MGTYSTNQFHYGKESGVLLAEASTLPNFQDGKGITLVSVVTGREITFQLAKENRDADNDVISWTYTSPEVPALTVEVIND